MNWEIAGVLAEVIGAATVVVTVFYLAIQIRQNRIAVEAATQASISEGWNSINAVVLGNSEVANIWTRGFADPEDLSEEEKVRFMILGQSYINQYTLEKRLADRDALPKDQWEAHATTMGHIMSSKGGEYILDNVAVSPDIDAVLKAYRGVKERSVFMEVPVKKA